MKVKEIKKAIGNIDVSNGFNTIKKTIKNSNEFALKTTEGFVNESLIATEKWQKVAQKAIDGGFKLASNQQDLVFQSLIAMKGQYSHGKKKVVKLFA